jgi:hypothetical protein
VVCLAVAWIMIRSALPESFPEELIMLITSACRTSTQTKTNRHPDKPSTSFLYAMKIAPFFSINRAELLAVDEVAFAE